MIDLHTHSTASDGTDKPEELVRLAKEIGLEAIALTDHDTSNGIEEFMNAGKKYGIETIPGMETTLKIDSCEVHLVSLYADMESKAMKDLLEELRESRVERNGRLLTNLRNLGVDITDEDLAAFGSKALSKGHFARIMCKKGYGESPDAVFDKYLNRHGLAYAERMTPDPKELVDKIHAAGGLCFVAHVYQIDRNSLDHSFEICERMLDYGADGLETLYSEYTEEMRIRAEEVAARRHVLRSGGSDYHGTNKEHIKLGTGNWKDPTKQKLDVPMSFLEAIKKKHFEQ